MAHRTLGLLVIALAVGGSLVLDLAPPEVSGAMLRTAAAEDCVYVNPQTGVITVYPGECTPDNP